MEQHQLNSTKSYLEKKFKKMDPALERLSKIGARLKQNEEDLTIIRKLYTEAVEKNDHKMLELVKNNIDDVAKTLDTLDRNHLQSMVKGLY